MFNEWVKPACLSLLLLSPMGAHAAGQLTPMSRECTTKAAHAYEIHPDVIYAILMVEGGTVGKNSRPNDNGTYDIGPGQINSMHRGKLAALDISEDELRNNGCTNVTVLAWHLATVLTPEVRATIIDQESYLRAIARYHSATPKFNEIYAGKLRAAFATMYAEDAK